MPLICDAGENSALQICSGCPGNRALEQIGYLKGGPGKGLSSVTLGNTMLYMCIVQVTQETTSS